MESLKGIRDSLIIRRGEIYFGHEFHRWELINESHDSKHSGTEKLRPTMSTPHLWTVKGWGVSNKEEGWSKKNFHASWMHLHWASCIKLALRWREAVLISQRI